MPTYTYACKKCGLVSTALRLISERDKPFDENCENGCSGKFIKRELDAPFVTCRGMIRAPRRGRGGFNDVLNKVHETTPGSQLDETSMEMR
jgi:hypothetical protein